MTVKVVKREQNVFFYEGSPGDHISRCVQEIISDLNDKFTAQALKFMLIPNSSVPTELEGNILFNGTNAHMTRQSNWETVVAEWEADAKEAHEKHKASPEYRAREEAFETLVVLEQARMDNLWPKIQKLLETYADGAASTGLQPNGETAVKLFGYFRVYIPLADSRRIDSRAAELVELLECCNYKESEYVGPAELIDTPYKQRAYIAGQIISGIRKVGTCHQIFEHMITKAKLDTHEAIPYVPEGRPPLGKNPFAPEGAEQ